MGFFLGPGGFRRFFLVLMVLGGDTKMEKNIEKQHVESIFSERKSVLLMYFSQNGSGV